MSMLSLQTNFFVGDGFPDVPFTQISMQFVCGHGVSVPASTDAVKQYLASVIEKYSTPEIPKIKSYMSHITY